VKNLTDVIKFVHDDYMLTTDRKNVWSKSRRCNVKRGWEKTGNDVCICPTFIDHNSSLAQQRHMDGERRSTTSFVLVENPRTLQMLIA